jgi:hypothetical protein
MKIHPQHIPMRTVAKLARHCHAQMRKADSQGEYGKAHYHEGKRDAFNLTAHMLRPIYTSPVALRSMGVPV